MDKALADRLPDDIRRLLRLDDRIVGIRVARRGLRVYAMQSRPESERPAGWILEAMARELEGKPTLPEHRWAWIEGDYWLADVVPLANAVAIGYELQEQGFPQADAESPSTIRLRSVSPD